MSLTASFLFLFITIVIPGFIFQRIYFFGDFSKQFTTKENVPKLLLTTLLPGLIISTFYLPFYNYFVSNDVKIDQILKIFEMLSKSKLHENESLLKVFGNYSDFIFYCFFEFLFAAIIGFLMSRALVRGLKLDRKWKTLRYKNQWYYVFSGEVFDFNKFKQATKSLARENKKRKDILLARVDVLIKGAEGKELYTGYVADYDLNPIDISKLDNLYLLDAIRYKSTELNEGIPNIKQPYITEKKQIPGELFVLNMANMVNMNVSYLITTSERNQNEKGVVNSFFNLILRTFTIVLLIPLATFIFYSPDWFPYFKDIPIDKKIIFFGIYMNFLRFIIPTYNKESKLYYYRRKDLIIAFVLMIGFVLFFLLWFNRLNQH